MKKKTNKTDRKAVYSHTEVALMYFPHIQPKSASRQLSRWILKDEELCNKLIAAGYRKGQRLYSPVQQDILYDYLGEPGNRHVPLAPETGAARKIICIFPLNHLIVF